MNKIFEEYAKKYPFLNELSERERSIIICMMYENKSPS